MPLQKITRLIIIVGVLLINIGCDQLSKNIVRQKIDYNEEISLMNDHLTLMKVENSGAFLSLGDSLPPVVRFIALGVLPVIALVLSAIFLVTKHDLKNITVLGICFVLGGGIGNVYDRLVHGSVTDFLHIDFGLFQTGIFNMADVSIMTGTFFIVMSMYFKRAEVRVNR